MSCCCCVRHTGLLAAPAHIVHVTALHASLKDRAAGLPNNRPAAAHRSRAHWAWPQAQHTRGRVLPLLAPLPPLLCKEHAPETPIPPLQTPGMPCCTAAALHPSLSHNSPGSWLGMSFTTHGILHHTGNPRKGTACSTPLNPQREAPRCCMPLAVPRLSAHQRRWHSTPAVASTARTPKAGLSRVLPSGTAQLAVVNSQEQPSTARAGHPTQAAVPTVKLCRPATLEAGCRCPITTCMTRGVFTTNKRSCTGTKVGYGTGLKQVAHTACGAQLGMAQHLQFLRQHTVAAAGRRMLQRGHATLGFSHAHTWLPHMARATPVFCRHTCTQMEGAQHPWRCCAATIADWAGIITWLQGQGCHKRHSCPLGTCCTDTAPHCCRCTVESEGLGTRPMHQQQPGTQRQQLTSGPGVCDMIQADHSSRRYNNRWEQAPTLLPRRQPHTLVFV